MKRIRVITDTRNNLTKGCEYEVWGVGNKPFNSRLDHVIAWFLIVNDNNQFTYVYNDEVEPVVG